MKRDLNRVSAQLLERLKAEADEAKNKSKERFSKLLRAKIEQLLEAGVARAWIADYLDCPVRTVNAVTKTWKRDKLPLILQKRFGPGVCKQ